MNPLDAALRYASLGWAVLPIQPGSKLPASAHGVKDASTDPAQIRAWFEGRDDLNVAVAAGRASNLICFDIDPRNGGDAGWGAWLAMGGPHDDGPHALTAGGGSHYLAVYDPAWRSSKLAQGVDLLSDGRYFLVWPSKINGRSAGYEWEASSDPSDGIAPFKIPAAWSAAYAAQAAKKPSSTGDGGGLLPVGSRNAGLAALAGAMRHHGMGQAEILAALSVANELRCNPPLPSSELSQIVDSICRYQPDADTALDAATGDAAAEALSIKPPPSDYHLEQASGWLSQPALPSWLIKGWLPDSGLAMLFGPSGAGKTFCALDMAASIASGKPWHGHKVAQGGAVIYLAGEGHYGLRMRVAAWAQQHGPEGLEHLYISNRGIDLDAPQAAAEVIRAIKEPSPTKVSLVIIDTLATHFGGEENSARDTRQLLSAAQVIGRAYGCVVCLIHHTGLGPADRARGSSSLKAAMDWQMLLASAAEDGITLSCTKAKDSAPPQPLAARLQRVTLTGWQDEDGEGVSGAVFEVIGHAEAKAKSTKPKPLSKHAKNLILLEAAWRLGGCALGADGRAVVSRQAMIDTLLADEYSPRSASEMVKKSGSLSSALVGAQTIELGDAIWTVCDVGLAGSWAMQSKQKKDV